MFYIFFAFLGRSILNEHQHFLSLSLKTGYIPRNFVEKRTDFKFIDLFCGIGGMRMPFEKLGGRCVFSSDWDKFARQTYLANFNEEPVGDITKINESEIPDHDVLLAGFPCQPFSIAGISKRNSLNRPVGFEDETQGTLFFDVKRIIKAKRPKAFLLENVKNLERHDKGKTFKTIIESLSNLGYHIFHQVIDAKNFVPQHRERIFIVGFERNVEFNFPEIPSKKPKLSKILEKNPDKKYTLTLGVWNALKRHAARHKAAGNGFGFGIPDTSGVSRTLSARYYKDGGEILISQGRGQRPRRLTPRECAKLMGFPGTFKIPVSDHQAYRQFGNSVVVPVVQSVAERMTDCLLAKVPVNSHVR